MFAFSLYESVFNSSPIGNYLLSPSPEATILAVNDAFLKAASRTRQDLIGVSLFVAFPANPDDPEDTGESDLRNSLARVIATGKPDTLPAQRYPIQITLPNGDTRYEERFWNAVSTPIFDEEGKLLCISHCTIDVTRQVQAEAALRQSERQAIAAAHQAQAERHRLDALLEATSVGIIMNDANGAILLANAAHRRLWGEQHPIARNIEEFREWHGWWADGSERHGRRLQPHEWTTARILRGEEALHDIIEIESFDTPPVRRIVINSGAPIKDDRGTIIGAIVAQMDITDRIKAEEALRQADRRKDEFLAMLAHELRNPLAPIASAAALLELGCGDAARVRKASAIISRQVEHMTGLVNDLLDVSRVTRGLVTLNKARVDAKRILVDAIEQVRPLIETRRHHLTVHASPASAFVLGDQKRLVQIMANLLNNAAKYTPEGGDIVLNMEVDAGYVKMTVADNGIGMAPDLVSRAFELFAQAERTSDRSQGGLGIGLALVKSLLELHGGTITAYSEGIGKGSKFTVCLPHVLEQETTDVFSTGRSASIEAVPAVALKVMVVDDNADAAQMLAMLVEALGHRVLIETSSKKALDRAKAEVPDIFLLDIGLPDMDGNELARRLRADPETAKAILIAVSGYGQEQDRNCSLAAGFDHHFVKPVDSRKLTALLNETACSWQRSRNPL